MFYCLTLLASAVCLLHTVVLSNELKHPNISCPPYGLCAQWLQQTSGSTNCYAPSFLQYM